MKTDTTKTELSDLLVTVMIPCYNQAKELAKAIESALSQTYSPLEIIVADDSSTDNTEEVVHKYLSDKRLTYIKRPINIGRVANYHTLVYKDSLGEWLINLDGDDYWINNNFIKNAMDIVVNDPYLVLIFGRQKYYNKSLNILWENPLPYLENLMDGKELFLRYPTISEGIPHMATLYKKSIALKAKIFTNNIIFADAEAMLRIIPFGKVAFINIFAGIWNDHGNNASYTPQINKRIENHLMITSTYDFFCKLNIFTYQELSSWREKFLTRVIRENCYFYLDNSDLKNGYFYLKEASSEIKIFSLLQIFFNPRFLLKLLLSKWYEQIKRWKGLNSP